MKEGRRRGAGAGKRVHGKEIEKLAKVDFLLSSFAKRSFERRVNCPSSGTTMSVVPAVLNPWGIVVKAEFPADTRVSVSTVPRLMQRNSTRLRYQWITMLIVRETRF